MKPRISSLPAFLPLVSILAATTGGAFADGIAVGDSTFFDTLDYSDTFTGTDDGGAPNRPYQAAIQPAPAYVVENNHGNPPIAFQIGAGFSFAADTNPGAQGFVPGANPYPIGLAPNASGAGSGTGFTQTGGGGLDYGMNYGLRDEYVVQVDAVQVPDRIDISSGAGLGIGAPSSLSVFFRGGGNGDAALFNGTTDTSIQSELPAFSTGITGFGDWHNYAVRFDREAQEIEIYVDGTSKAVLDLTTFAGGIYANWSNLVVGAGAGVGAGDRTWTDNFQVGGFGPPNGPLPDPGDLPGLPDNLVSFWDFDEAAGPVEGFLIQFAYDRLATRDGSFQGSTARVPGLVGLGAVQFNDMNGDSVNVGADGFSFTEGVSIEAYATTNWAGTDEAEFFRKEDGNNRLLFSFQSPANINNAFGQLVGTANTAGISLGINVNGAYGELDIAFDGLDGRPTVAEVADGNPHHFVATFDAASGLKAIYYDGQLLGSLNLGENAVLLSGGAAPAHIGASGGGEPFTGILDEVAVYSEGLDAGTVAAHFLNVQGGSNYFQSAPPALFAITASTFDIGAQTVSLTWNSIPGRTYTVEGSLGLVTWFEIQDGIAATGFSTTTSPDPLDLSIIFPEVPADLYLRIRDTTPQ